MINPGLELAILADKMQNYDREVAICVSALSMILMTRDEDCFSAVKRAMLLQTRRAVQRWEAPDNADEDWVKVKAHAIQTTQDYLDEEK
tara:strand:- start:6045 stop:6311 length:267 start_codon:yes stop_codon:yes gene_type:complete